MTLFKLRQLTRGHMLGTGCSFTQPMFIGKSLTEREAIKTATSFGHDQVNTGHLFLAILKVEKEHRLIDLLRTDRTELVALTTRALENFSTESESGMLDYETQFSQISLTEFSNAAAEALTNAKDESRLMQHNFVCTEHLLLGLARAQGEVREFFLSNRITIEQLRARIKDVDGTREGFVSLDVPFSSRVKRALCNARDTTEQKQLVTSKAILEALVALNDGVASLVLRQILIQDKESQMLSNWLESPSTELV
ncbi:MAG TPA: Clp protease N-terminal domain-containing protein [Drouetiella sp.]